MLIAKKHIKNDIVIPNNETPKKRACSQDGYLYIKSSVVSGKIEFIKCCFKYDEVLFSIDKDEFRKLNAEELKQLIYKTYNVNPANHNYGVIPACYTEMAYCDYSKFKLSTLCISISKACNILCRMCWHHAISNKTIFEDKDLYFETLYKCKGMHLDRLMLTESGEPFFYKNETLKFISGLTTDDCKTVYMITNATLLNDDDIKLLNDISLKNNIKIKIVVSCSAITADTYKKVHNNDNFDKVIHNIRLLKHYNMLDSINYVVQSVNIHELDMINDFWKNDYLFVNISYIRQSYPGITKEEENRILSIVQSKIYNK